MAEADPSRVTCEQATALLIDYITGELDDTTRQVLEQHLERCADCGAFLQTYQETIRTTRTLAYEAMPVDLQDRLLLTLRQKIAATSPP